MSNSTLLDEIYKETATADSSLKFLQRRGVLKTSMSCSSCNASMNLQPCTQSKSADLFIWYCKPCRKYTNVRTGSVLSGKNLTLKSFLLLIFFCSCKDMSNVLISQIIALSENTVADWRQIIYSNVARFLLANPTLLGGPGVVVELDEAKFGKRKYHKGAYREGMWVLGAIDRQTQNCFLIPCPNNKRDAATLMPIITQWILPGSIVHTDEWRAYSGLTQAGYTHQTVNHSIQFVDPAAGTHTNTQEGLWHHVKRTVVGSRNLEFSLIDFIFRRRFKATGGNMQIVNCFNGYLTVLA